jgi:hypothetical protein
MEFMRITLGMLLMFGLTATSYRCRYRATNTSNLPQDRRLLLHLMTIYHRLNVMLKLKGVLPFLMLYPTLVLFLEAFTLSQFSAWVTLTSMHVVSLCSFAYIGWMFIPRKLDVSGTVFSTPKYWGRREFFTPNLFIKPLWYSPQESGFWEQFAMALNAWAVHLQTVRRVNEPDNRENSDGEARGPESR